MLLVNESKTINVLLLDASGLPTGGTITYEIYDNTNTLLASGNCTVVSGVTGLYTMTVTPTAAGTWTVKFSCSDPVRNAVVQFDVSMGVEQSIDTKMDTAGTNIAAVLADTDELQTDWVNGGRLDLLIDAIKAKTDTINWANITSVLTDTDELQTDWVNGGRLDLLIDAIKAKTDTIVSGGATEANVDAVETKVDAAQTDITNILTDTDELQTDWVNGGRLDLLIDAIKAKTDTILWTDVTSISGIVAAIQARTDLIPPDPADASDVADAITAAHTTTDALVTTVDTVVDGIQTDVTSILTDTADIQPRVPRTTCHMDFWSVPDDEVPITNSATNINLPNVVVADLPTGCTIVRVIAILKIALIRDGSGTDNAINNVSMIVAVDSASDYTSTIPAITISDNSWKVDVSTSTDRGGDVILGDTDVASEVTGNATYYLRFENAQADGNPLNLEDVQVGLRVYFTV